MSKKFQHNKSSGFKVPEGYFQSLDSKILDRTKTNSVLNKKPESGFKVPEGYFENFSVKHKKGKVINLKQVLYISSIAAVLALLFTIFIPKEEPTFDSLETATIENYLLEEHYETSEIASLLADNELSLETFNLVPSDETIEDYLIQNTSIDNLIDF